MMVPLSQERFSDQRPIGVAFPFLGVLFALAGVAERRYSNVERCSPYLYDPAAAHARPDRGSRVRAAFHDRVGGLGRGERVALTAVELRRGGHPNRRRSRSLRFWMPTSANALTTSHTTTAMAIKIGTATTRRTAHGSCAGGLPWRRRASRRRESGSSRPSGCAVSRGLRNRRIPMSASSS